MPTYDRTQLEGVTLGDRLQELIDRQDILQVLHRYCRGLDRLDVELTQSCYFEDAIEDHGSFIGPAKEFIGWANTGTESFLNTHHCILNHYCEIDGNDAHAETYYLFMGYHEKPPHLMSMGRYIDHFQRRNGEWRIANRIAVIEKNFSLIDHPTLADHIPRDNSEPGIAPFTRASDDVSYQRPVRPRRS